MVRAFLLLLCLALAPAPLFARDLATYKLLGEKAYDKDTDDAIKAYEGALSLAANDPLVLHRLVRLYSRKDRLDDAQRMAERLAAQSDPDARARGLLDLGNLADIRGDIPANEQFQQSALDLAIKENLPLRQAEALGNLGSLATVNGDYSRAEDLHRQALAIDLRIDNLLGEADDWANLGYLAIAREDWKQGEAHYKRALDIDKQIGRLEGLVYDYEALGRIEWARDDRAMACEYFLEAVKVSKKLGNEDSEIGRISRMQLDLCPPVS